VIGAAVAVAMIAGGAWAAGTALHGSPSTVKFRAAAAVGGNSTGNGSSGSSGTNGTSGTNGPHGRRFMGGGGVGPVTGVDSRAQTFTVTHPTRPAPGSAPNTPGAAPVAPATATTTVKTSSSTVFYVTGPATPSNIAVGQEMVAFGTNSNGTITASRVSLVDAGILKTPKKPAPVNPNASPNVSPNAGPNEPNANAPKLPGNRPFGAGTVKSVTGGANGSVTVTLTELRGGDVTVDVPTSATMVWTQKGSFSSLAVNDTALVRGTKNADGSITATVIEVVKAALKGQAGAGVRPGFGPGLGFGFGPGPGFGFGFGPGLGFGGRRGGFPGGAPGAGHWSPPSGSAGTPPSGSASTNTAI
jgi:hypothetical protein